MVYMKPGETCHPRKARLFGGALAGLFQQVWDLCELQNALGSSVQSLSLLSPITTAWALLGVRLGAAGSVI